MGPQLHKTFPKSRKSDRLSTTADWDDLQAINVDEVVHI